MSPVNRMNCNYNRYQTPPSRTMMNARAAESVSSGSCACGSLDSMPQKALWNQLNEVSFAVDDMLLYLDTHPWDTDALESIRARIRQRDQLLKTYAERFEPLTIDREADSSSAAWDWILQPWPWEIPEKGGCR